MPQIIIHHGRYFDGFPKWLRIMFLWILSYQRDLYAHFVGRLTTVLASRYSQHRILTAPWRTENLLNADLLRILVGVQLWGVGIISMPNNILALVNSRDIVPVDIWYMFWWKSFKLLKHKTLTVQYVYQDKDRHATIQFSKQWLFQFFPFVNIQLGLEWVYM